MVVIYAEIDNDVWRRPTQMDSLSSWKNNIIVFVVINS
jgi:hypothetical protein